MREFRGNGGEARSCHRALKAGPVQVGNRDAENLPSALEASLHPVGTLGGNLATKQPAFDRSAPAPARLPRERGARKQSSVECLAN